MPAPNRLSALHQHLDSGVFGAGDGRPGVELEEQRPSALVQINGAPPQRLRAVTAPLGLDADARANRAATGRDVVVLWTGADQWLVVSTRHRADELGHALRTALGDGDSTLTDLSHARTVVRVGGAMARDLLAKGCPLDVDGLVVGDSASTMLGPFNVIVHCRAEHSLDLYVFRSFGLAMWEWIKEEAMEFGVRVLGEA